jgi:beta-alanine--pyruvate transaminase
MPFTPTKRFKAQPRLISRAKGLRYYKPSGEAVLDATSGMWCSNAGHGSKSITAAISYSAEHLDFAPSFNLAHPASFELASRLVEILLDGIHHIFLAILVPKLSTPP